MIMHATFMLVLVLSRSVVSDSLWSHSVVCQAPLPTGFSRQECLSGLPFPTPKYSRPRIESVCLVSPASEWFFTTGPPGKPTCNTNDNNNGNNNNNNSVLAFLSSACVPELCKLSIYKQNPNLIPQGWCYYILVWLMRLGFRNLQECKFKVSLILNLKLPGITILS